VAETTVQSIFGASEADVRKLVELNDKAEEEAPPPPSPAPKVEAIAPLSGGLASAADLLKQEEAQFIQPGSILEERANFKPDPSNVDKLVDFMRNQSSKSLTELKRDMQQNVYGQKDKPKFEINPQPAPGSSKSALPATRAVVVQETSLGDLTQPLAKRPSRFDKVEKVDVAQLTAAQLRVKQRQQKVNERLATSMPGERPDIDVFKNIFSDTDSESEDDDKDDSDQEDTFTFKTKSTKPAEKPKPTPVMGVPTPSAAADPAGKPKLTWQANNGANETKTEAKTEKMSDDDDIAPPKITFVSKRDRLKRDGKKPDVKTEKIEKVDDDDNIGPALPSNFNPTKSNSFPELITNQANNVVELSDDSDDGNCWVVEGSKKGKKEKKAKKEKKHKKEKKKKHKKEKDRH